MKDRRQKTEDRKGTDWRSAVVTVLDFVALLLIGASLVVVLGGGTKVHLGPVLVSLRGPGRLLLMAGVLAVARIAWAGRLPFAPAFAGASTAEEATAIDARLLGDAPVPPSLYGVCALLLVICLTALHAQVTHLRAVPDLEDPVFSGWRVAWVAHQIVRAPAHLFDANIFFPARLTFTYSDSLLLPAIVVAPLVWAGVDPLVASNLLLVAAFPLCAIAFCWTSYRLTGSVRAAFIAGLAGGLYPYHFEHYSHLELQLFYWVPLAVLELARVLRGGRVRDGLTLGAIVTAQALSSMYYGVMLVLYLAIGAVVMAVAWRGRPMARVARAAIVSVAVAFIAVAVLGPPYVRSLPDRGGGRRLDDTRGYSARPSEWLVANRRSATWGDVAPGTHHYPERELFPGAATPALALVAVAPPWSVPVAALVASGFGAFDWSLGVNGVSYGRLYDWLLPFRSLRSPARFAIFCGSSLILLGGYGARRLILASRRPRWQMTITIVLAVLVVADLRPRIDLVTPWKTAPPIYASVQPPMVLAEFPMDLGHNIAYMYFSTTHWARLVNGYSGYVPLHYDRLEPFVHDYWTIAALDRLRAEGVSHLTVNCAFYEDRGACARDLAALEATGRVRQQSAGRWEGGEVRLYALTRSDAR